LRGHRRDVTDRVARPSSLIMDLANCQRAVTAAADGGYRKQGYGRGDSLAGA
jgi:hypothetical protein